MIRKYQSSLIVSLDGSRLVHDKLRREGKHQENSIAKSDTSSYPVEMKAKFSIDSVFGKNRVLTVKETEMPMKKRGSFTDRSINDITNDNVSSFISPALYDVLTSMIYKSKSLSFCDDINVMNTRTYDVDRSKKTCFRLWGEHHSKRVKKFNNKDSFSRYRNCWCKNICMECVANMIGSYSSIIFEVGVSLDYPKQESMEYCIYKIIATSRDKNKLVRLTNNFERFIRHAQGIRL